MAVPTQQSLIGPGSEQPGERLDELDHLLVTALQTAPRADWRSIGAALDVDPTTAARRWARLTSAGLAWMSCYPAQVEGQPLPSAFIEIDCRPGRIGEVAAELAESLRKDSAKVSIKDGPWGREVVGTATGVVRFIGVDGYRWMIRCVINGAHETMEALEQEARAALADTVVRRGDTPLPVRTPLPVQLPEPMAEQLRAAAAAQQASQQTEAQGEQPPEPAARRSAEGSAMQQLRTTTGG
jgi:DNA-binding Lrp family transcriptional regulator